MLPILLGILAVVLTGACLVYGLVFWAVGGMR